MGARIRTAVAVALFASALFSAPTADAAFPGQNGKIAFETYRDGDYEIYSMDADGTNQTRLTNSSNTDTDPAWSPDGRKIAFASYRDGNGEIYVMNADGSDQTRIIDDPASNYSPAWSPDGTEIAFVTLRDGNTHIYSMKADGSGATQLTDGAGHDGNPTWSPDGTRIAFHRWTVHPAPDGTMPITDEIYVMGADGSNQVSIYSAVNSSFDLGDWSPDGAEIVFGNGGTIRTVNVDSGDLAVPASCYSNVFCGADVGLLYDPVWSPDGTKIAFAHRDCYFLRGFPCTTPHIQASNADGSEVTGLTDSGSAPSWQPIVNRPPDCSSVTPSRPVLTTQNRKLVPVTLEAASDADGDPVTFIVDGVTQDEPVLSRGDRTSPDAVDRGDGELSVRAERAGRGDGRVYRIAFTASDGRGGSCSDTTTVTVPRKKHRPGVDSAPPSYDSLVR